MNGIEPVAGEANDVEIDRLLNEIIDEVEFLVDDGPVRLLDEVEEEEDEEEIEIDYDDDDSDDRVITTSQNAGNTNNNNSNNDNNHSQNNNNINMDDKMDSAPELGIVHKINQMNAVEPSDSDSGSREYIIEKILDKKIDSMGCARYLVKWQGYGSKDNTWEPIEYLASCDKAMQAYEISQAQKLAEQINKRQQNLQNGDNPNGHAAKRPKFQNFEVNDIMGATLLKNEIYFLVSIADSTKKTFIRASLANKMFPGKVIDFYLKHIQWDKKPEGGAVH